MEDIGGERLKSVIPPEGFPIDSFIEIACQIGIYFYSFTFPSLLLILFSLSHLVSERLLTDIVVRGLDAVHSVGVMHQDLNPMNIVVNMETKALNIIDFGLASQMHTNEVKIKQKIIRK